MPFLSEFAWILQAFRLLRRFAPLLERVVLGDRPALPPGARESNTALSDQIADTHALLEARLNDLRKQAQEQNLKLNQIQDDLHGLQNQLDASLTLLRETKREIAALLPWLLASVVLSLAAVVFLVILVVRH